jgi:TolA-binding protein
MLEIPLSLRKTFIKYGLLVALFMLATACSPKKNTAGTRTYHSLTAHYNILFNGTESYKKGMYNHQNSYKDDYTELLPIFIYHDKDQLATISSEMDRSIKKAMKLISMHSITAKPEISEDKELTEKEHDYYNQTEFNKWVDDAYLLMGKAHFHKQEFDQAQETFQYVITNFPSDENAYEAKIWMARLSIEKNRIKEAEETLISLEKDAG